MLQRLKYIALDFIGSLYRDYLVLQDNCYLIGYQNGDYLYESNIQKDITIGHYKFYTLKDLDVK